MSAHPPTQDANSELVRILDAYLADRAAGRAPSVEDLVARHPELADELRECLASLELIKAAALKPQPPAVEQSPDVPAGEGEARTGILGDYRILREVGRGGMGVVYEAWQISLGRRVALKVLPFAATLDNRHLQRFKNEAQAAAQLHHSHIVPVFAVGVERGVHYYAMQFIDGRTLAAVIDELRQGPDPDPLAPTRINPSEDPQKTGPYLDQSVTTTTTVRANATTERSNKSTTFFRTAAQLTMQAAEALEHAHGLGVVHRDVKPANLLVDGRGHLWVTDFGLAQFGRDANLTVTGDLLGTLRYMSPEQASAKRAVIDHRTDIYSLGATLYELLTLHPVFDGNDRQALLTQILNDEPPPPRRLNKAVPLELDLITMKALAKNPDERYATAQEFADDLERFLDDKPVLARRPTLGQHVRKWARRHQALVAAGVVFGVLALGATSLSTVLIWQERNEATAQRDLAQDQKDKADAQREEAERQRRLAWRALEEMFADTTPLTPAVTAGRREFLLKSLDFYKEVAKRAAADSAARRDRGTAFRRLGDIRFQLGGEYKAHAEADYRESVRLFQELAGQFPDSAEDKFDLVSSQLKLSQLLRDAGHVEEANRILDEARTVSRGLAAAEPSNKLWMGQYVQVCEHSHQGSEHEQYSTARVQGSYPDVPFGQACQFYMGGPRDGTQARDARGGQNATRTLIENQSAYDLTATGAAPAKDVQFLPAPLHPTQFRLMVVTQAADHKVIQLPLPVPPQPPEPVQVQATPTPATPYLNPGWAAYTSAAPNSYLPYPYVVQVLPNAPVPAMPSQELALTTVSAEALNTLLDRVQLSHAKGATGPRTPLDSETVRRLNLITPQSKGPNLLIAVRNGAVPFPTALQDEKLAVGRERFVRKARVGVERVEKGEKIDAAIKVELRQDFEAMDKALRQQVNDLPFDEFLKARWFLVSLDDVVKCIEHNDLCTDPSQQFFVQGELTVPKLIDFMAEKKLRFGASNANSETAYLSLYRALSTYDAALPAPAK